jgi:hypothetical protein
MKLLDGIDCTLAVMSLSFRQLLRMEPRPEIWFSVRSTPDGPMLSFNGESFAIGNLCERFDAPDPVALANAFVFATLRDVAPELCDSFEGIS